MRLMKYSPIILLAAAFILGCSKSPNTSSKETQPSAAAVPQGSPAAVDKNTLGAITGVVSFKGAVPKLPRLDMTQDPACPTDPQPSDAVVVNNGKLANVFVYVKN